MDLRRNATMNPRYPRKRQNSVEKLMRPGLLLLALLIGFAFIYLLTPSPSAPPAMAEQTNEDYASAEEPRDPEDYNDEGDTAADEEIGETTETTETSNGAGDIGEGYIEEGQPRPGDNEAVDESDHEAIAEDQTGEDEGEDSDSEGRHRECIYVRSIDSFRVIDDRHLTVSTSPRRRYLVTLRNRCYGLKWSNEIAISSLGSWTCSYSHDTVVTEDRRCFIDDVERVESFAAAEQIVADRAADGDTE